MTESLKLSASAVNKFIWYSQNWGMTTLEIRGQKRFVADFFSIFEDTRMLDHFWGKFNSLYQRYGSRNALLNFYFELSPKYRLELIEFIMSHYNGEEKLNFNKEDE